MFPQKKLLTVTDNWLNVNEQNRRDYGVEQGGAD